MVLFERELCSAVVVRSDSTLKSYSLQVVPHGMDTGRFASRPWVGVGTVVGVGIVVGIENGKMTVLIGAGAGGVGHRVAAGGEVFVQAMARLMNSSSPGRSWIFPLACLAVVERLAC